MNILICDIFIPINWPELCISTFAGAVIGYFISIWASKNYEKEKHERELKELNDEFKSLEGIYDNHYYNGEKIKTKISEAKLQYYPEKGKSFHIMVTTYTDTAANPLTENEIQIWEGEINMVDKRFGDLSFNFIAPERMKATVGFKRIIFSKDALVMTLVGEKIDGHFDERFDKRIATV